MGLLPAFADPDKHLSVKYKPIEMDSAIELCNLCRQNSLQCKRASYLRIL